MPTKAEFLADAQLAAEKLRKTFEMSQTNAHTKGKLADAIPVRAEEDKVAETAQPAEAPVPFRAKHARPIGTDAIAGVLNDAQERIAATTAKMDQVVDKLTAVLNVAGAPRAAIGSPSPPSPKGAEQIASDITAAREFGKLRATLLKNGDMSFELPSDVVRASVAALTGEQREAFREVGRGVTQHLS